MQTKDKKSQLTVLGAKITVISNKTDDAISLTDMAKKFGDEVLIYHWMRNRNTLEFLGIWELIHNQNFKGLEFETFKKEAGLNSFHLSPKKWIDSTSAIGLQFRADAIKEHIILPNISKKQIGVTYASEADVLNVALFGMTAKEWRAMNPNKDGNIRDYASVIQLLVLANIESTYAEYIRDGMSQ